MIIHHIFSEESCNSTIEAILLIVQINFVDVVEVSENQLCKSYLNLIFMNDEDVIL